MISTEQAHFKSRDALIVEALQAIFGEVEENTRQLFGSLPPRQALIAFTKWYLSPEHRDDALRSCPIVAFGSDVPRQSTRFRKTFQAGVKKIAEILAESIAAAGIASPQELAMSLLSALAGSINVSRGVEERRLSDGILVATRQSILLRMGLQDQAS